MAKTRTNILVDIIFKIKFYKVFKFYYRNYLRILCYHGVTEGNTNIDIKLDDLHIPENIFRKQLNIIKKEGYKIISADDLLEIVLGKKKKIPNAILITFDDGYQNNYLNIFKKHSIPFVECLTTEFVDSNKLFWWERLRLLLSTFRGQINLTINGVNKNWVIENKSSSHKIIGTIELELLKCNEKEKNEIFSQIENQIPKLGQKIPEEFLKLKWTEVEEMCNSGVEIASHTLTHPFLSSIVDQSKLKLEIIESKLKIEKYINKPIKIFSIPHGKSDSFSENVIGLAKEAGYKFAFTNIYGFNKWSDLNPFYLKRIVPPIEERKFIFELSGLMFFRNLLSKKL